MREFLFFMIKKLGERASAKISFPNSFLNTRKGIADLFNYLDCTGGGVIDAGMIYKGVSIIN